MQKEVVKEGTGPFSSTTGDGGLATSLPHPKIFTLLDNFLDPNGPFLGPPSTIFLLQGIIL